MNENLGQDKELVNANGENVINILVIQQNETNNCESSRNNMELCHSAWPSAYSNLSATNVDDALASDSGPSLESKKKRIALYKSQSFTVVETKDAVARKRKMTCTFNEVDQTKHRLQGRSPEVHKPISNEVYKNDKIHPNSSQHAPRGGLSNLVKSVSLPPKPLVQEKLQFSVSPFQISSNLRNSSIQSLMGTPSCIPSKNMVSVTGTVQHDQMSPLDSGGNKISPFWVLNACSGVSHASTQSLMRSPIYLGNVQTTPDSGFCTPSQEVQCGLSSSTPLRPQSHFRDTIKPKLLSSCFSTDNLLSEHQDDSMSSELCIVDHSEDSTDSVASLVYKINPQPDGKPAYCNQVTPQIEEQQQSLGTLTCHVSGSHTLMGSDHQLKIPALNYQGSKVLTEAQEKILERPIYSYMDLIKMALSDSEVGEMTLKEILKWIEDHFPYFKIRAKKSWKNSIRHNLSLHPDFIKVEDKKHAGKWKVVADAKKYRAKLPKPQVVKNPEQSQFFTRTRREGPQPILPKSVPFALVPLPFSFSQPLTDQMGQTVSLQLGRSIDEQLRQVANQQLGLNVHPQLRLTTGQPTELRTKVGVKQNRQLVPKVQSPQQPLNTHLGLFQPGGQQIILPAQSLDVSNFLQQQFDQLSSSHVQTQSNNPSFQVKQGGQIILFPHHLLENQQAAGHLKQDPVLSNQGQYTLQHSLYLGEKDEQMSVMKSTSDPNQPSHIIGNQSVQPATPQAQSSALEPVQIQILRGDNDNEKKIVFMLNPKGARTDVPKSLTSQVSDVEQKSSNSNLLGTICTNNTQAQNSDVKTALKCNTNKGRKTPGKRRAGKAHKKVNKSVKTGVANETSQQCKSTQRNQDAPVFNLEVSLKESRLPSDAGLGGAAVHKDLMETTSCQQVDSAPQHCIIRQAWAQVYAKGPQVKKTGVGEDQASDTHNIVGLQVGNEKIRSDYNKDNHTSSTHSNPFEHSQNRISPEGTISGISCPDVTTANRKQVSRNTHGCSRKLLILQNHPKHRSKNIEKNGDKENRFVEKVTDRHDEKKLPLVSFDNLLNHFNISQASSEGDKNSLVREKNSVTTVSHPLSERLDLAKAQGNDVVNAGDPSFASNISQAQYTATSSTHQRGSGPSRRKQVIIPLTTEVSPQRMLQPTPSDKGRHTSTPTLPFFSANNSPLSVSPRGGSDGDSFFHDNGHFSPSHSSMFHGSPNTSHSYPASPPHNMSLSPPQNLSHFLSLTMTPPPGGQSLSLTSTPKHCQENTSFLDSSLLDMSLLENLESLMQNTSWTQLKTP